LKKYLKKLPKEIQDLVYLAGDIAEENKMPAYLVGGFVRDLISGVKNLDLDITVEGDGIKFAECLAAATKSKLICHRRFGTATVVLKHGLKIDIATARSETYPYPASLPVVTPGTIKEDLCRRDFTINAMAISINRHNFGSLIDVFAGQDDLRRKIIRILHDLSFIDDPTRILRAVRFATRYSFKIEHKSAILLKEAVADEMLKKVQPQRLRDELILILKESRPLEQIRQLERTAGFGFFHLRKAIPQLQRILLCSIERQVGWFIRTYPNRRELDVWLVYLIGLLDNIEMSKVRDICRSFVFRRGEEKRILSYKKISHKFISTLSDTKIKPSQIFGLLEPLSYEVIILIKAKYSNRYLRKHIEDFFEIYNGMRIYVSGADLHGLGVKPGPDYRRIFSKVLNAKLNGIVKTRGEELSLIRRLIKIR